MSPAAAIAGLSGRGQASPTNEISIEQLRAALNGASPPGAAAGAKQSGEIVVFSPNGAALSEAQRAALLKQADRLKPMGIGTGTERVSLPPSAAPTPRPPASVEEKAPEGNPSEDSKDASEEHPARGTDEVEANTAPGDDSGLLSGEAFGGEPVGIHDELRDLLDEIAPVNRDLSVRIKRSSRIAWRNPSLPRGSRPVFIIGPPGSGSDRIEP